MGVDFSSLVLGPAQAVFGIAVQFDPRRSQPGMPPFISRAIFSSVEFDVQGVDGSVISDQKTTLAIRDAEYVKVPEQGDKVTVLEGPYAGQNYFLADGDEDGQGGTVYVLKKEVESLL